MNANVKSCLENVKSWAKKNTNQGKRPEETDPTKDHLLIFVNVLFTKKGEGNILFLLFEALGCNSADAIDVLLYTKQDIAPRVCYRCDRRPLMCEDVREIGRLYSCFRI